jgi:predicted porin
MNSMKLKAISVLVGTLMAGSYGIAMADSTTDYVNKLVEAGMITPEAGDNVKNGHEKDMAALKSKDVVKDFMESDAPFKTNFSIGEHKGDLQFYGVIDIGGMTTNHSYPTNSQLPNQFYPYQAYNRAYAGRQSGWNQGGLQDSRFGFKGGVDLFHAGENNIKFIYQLEAGFNPLNGTLNDAAKTLSQNPNGGHNSTSADSSLNGELFGRQAWAGLDGGKLGLVTAGLQYNPFYNIFGEYDPTNKADSFSPFGESGTVGGGGGVSEDARMKNSIKYANKFDVFDGKLSGSAIYQFGNASGDMSKGYGLGLQAGYETDMFGIQVAYDKFEDAIVATNSMVSGATINSIYGQILGKAYNTEATLVALKFTPNKEWKFKGGWEWYERQSPSDLNLNYGSLWGYTLTDSNVYSGFGVADTGNVSQAYNVLFAGAEYNFGERFAQLNGLTLAVGYYDTIAERKVTGGTASGAVGTINTWTAVVDYKLNKRFDVYGAFTNNYFSGASRTTNAANQDAFGLGVRMKF